MLDKSKLDKRAFDESCLDEMNWTKRRAQRVLVATV